MAEIRKFSVHPQIIYNVIVAQSGTLGKAVAECYQNSADANSSRLDITIDRKSIRIQDDGQGFRTRQEIESWFEVFGFPHEDGDRIYGKFGIGRGQLWSFCSAVWRTGTFKMDVDIKRRGLDYHLVEDLEPVKGVLIEGEFYSPLTTLELSTFQKELTELLRFGLIPVTLNGNDLRKEPAKEKWDFDTQEAWIKITEGGQLAVYNLGVLVQRYPSHQFGNGGLVVTKPGVKLALNMARNEILVAECEVWKRIRKLLQSNSDQRVRTKRTRMSEAELENAARRFLAGEINYNQVAGFKLITDIVGRSHTIRELLLGTHKDAPLTTAERGSQLGERAHTRKLAFVLAPETLERFGAESVADFKAKLVATLHEDPAASRLESIASSRYAIEEVQAAAPTLRAGHDVLKDSELSKAERASVRALEEMSRQISHALVSARLLSSMTADRSIHVGVSDVAEAWTDGSNRIVVERRQLKLMRQGIGGFVGLVNLLVHEYLHDSDDTGSHTHDQQFYARYHDATCSQAGVLNQAVLRGLRRWLVALHSLGQNVPTMATEHLDEIEQIERKGAESAQAERS